MTAFGPGYASSANFYHYTFDDDLYTFRIGVNYKFGSFFGH
jgi:hypothetical protein